MLGFAERSGKLLTGTFSVEEGIRYKRAKLVMAAADMNPKRVEILSLWCKDMGIPFQAMGTKEEYGQLLKKRPLGLMALTDEQMARGIIKAVSADRGD